MKTTTLAKLFGLSVMMSSAALLAADMNAVQFDALDQNQDGQLTASEASRDAKLSENWTEVDKDANGAIDRAEFSAFESMQGKSEQPAGKE
ncbi:hypothetical protein [Sedimenticola sp.]|uniref:hypothetical protein n=1 Tax=Sedimenticola sp. TaxID=1940285 RepID=UPI003D0ADF51